MEDVPAGADAPTGEPRARCRPGALARLALPAIAAWWLPACAIGGGAPGAVPPAPPAAGAAPSPSPGPTAAASGGVTMLVLDMSGSMTTNDPDGVRCAAAQVFIGLSRPDELVGVIGLAGTAELWQAPAPMTPAGRRDLQAIVAGRCRPGGNTATYDALSLAYDQLVAAFQRLGDAGAGMRGSVVLLTDGTPEPDPGGQIARIEGTLDGRFAARRWRVDTIAVGTTETDFDFLSSLSSDTGGTFYDASLGRTATALNLLPLFVRILQDENGRTPGQPIPPTPLAGGPVARSFSVTPYSDHLDVVVVCDQPDDAVRLTSPLGVDVAPAQVVSAGPGQPAFGAVFSIDQPVTAYAGPELLPWTVTVGGRGAFAMESLVAVRLRVVVQAAATAPLGGQLAVSAAVEDLNGRPYAGPLALAGTLGYSGGGRPPPAPFALDAAGANRYRGGVPLPADWPPGPYLLTVTAAETSRAQPLGSGVLRVRLDLLPAPRLDPAADPATRWPAWLGIYDLPVLAALGPWARQGLPGRPLARVGGVLLRPDGTPYVAPATVSARAGPSGAAATVPAGVTLAPGGRFQLTFPVQATGDYRVTLQTGGVRADSHGDLLSTTQTVGTRVEDATAAQVARAAAATAALAALLLLAAAYVRYCSLRPRYGTWAREDGTKWGRLDRARGPLQARRDLRSEDAGLPSGLRLRFRYRGGILVMPEGPDARRWHPATGGPLPRRPARLRRLVYDIPAGDPPAADDEAGADGAVYLIEDGVAGGFRLRRRLAGGLGLALGLAALAVAVPAGLAPLGVAGALAALLALPYGLPGLPARRRRGRERRARRDSRR